MQPYVCDYCSKTYLCFCDVITHLKDEHSSELCDIYGIMNMVVTVIIMPYRSCLCYTKKSSFPIPERHCRLLAVVLKSDSKHHDSGPALCLFVYWYRFFWNQGLPKFWANYCTVARRIVWTKNMGFFHICMQGLTKRWQWSKKFPLTNIAYLLFMDIVSTDDIRPECDTVNKRTGSGWRDTSFFIANILTFGYLVSQLIHPVTLLNNLPFHQNKFSTFWNWCEIRKISFNYLIVIIMAIYMAHISRH